MSLIPLNEAKLHLRVDHNYDDADIQLKLNAAERAAINYIQRNVYLNESDVGNDESPLIINDSFKAAVMLILGELYTSREDFSSDVLTRASRCLLDPYRINIGI